MRKNILITAGAIRIGSAIVKHFSKDFNVIFTYKNSKEEAQALTKQLPNTRAYYLDLIDLDSVEAFWANFNEPIDILINNASSFKSDTLETLDYKVLHENLTTNLIGPIFMIKSLLTQRKECIVISLLDKWAYSYPSNFLSYSIAKCALENFTHHLNANYSQQMKAYGILLGFTLYNKKFSLEFFKNNQSKYPSNVDALIKTIDTLIKTCPTENYIIDLEKRL